MDTLLRAALALPDCPLSSLSLPSSATNHHNHKYQSYQSSSPDYKLPDKHILANRLRTQLRRAAQRANLHHLVDLAAHSPSSLPSTPTPTSPSCPDGDLESDQDLNAFTASWTLASGPLSPPASIARFSCAPTHVIPRVTLPSPVDLLGQPLGPVSHHLAPECRSVASIHVVTSSSNHVLRARRPSAMGAFAFYAQEEDEDDEDDEGDYEEDVDEGKGEDEDNQGATAPDLYAAADAHNGWFASAALSVSPAGYVPPAAYAEMEEAAWTILRMMQDSQVLPTHDDQSEGHQASPPSSSSSSAGDPDVHAQVDSSPSSPHLGSFSTSHAPYDGGKAPQVEAGSGDTPVDPPQIKPEPLPATTISSSDPSSTPLSHRLALTRRRVQSELAHRRPSALTLSPALAPGAGGARRGSLSSALSSPAKSATRMHFPIAPLTPTGAGAARTRRRSLSASEHLIMGQLARSPLALAFSKQQQQQQQQANASSSLTTLAEAGTDSHEPTSPRASRTNGADDVPTPSCRPLLTSTSVPRALASLATTRRSSAAAAAASSRIPRELANLVDFLKPPPSTEADSGTPSKMAASPLSASLLASGVPVDQMVAAVVSSAGATAAVGARRKTGRLGTIEEAVGAAVLVKRENGAAAEQVTGGRTTRKRTRQAAAVAHDGSSEEEEEGHGDEAAAESEDDLPPRASKRARKAPAANGRSRATAASPASAGNINGRRSTARLAAKAVSAPAAVGRVTRGRSGRTSGVVVKQEEQGESLSEAEAASDVDMDMDDTASLSSVPSSPEL